MKNQMLLDAKMLKRSFLIILGVGLLIMAVSTLIAALNWTTETVDKGMIDIYDVAYRPFVTLFPLFCIIPCLMLFEEKQSGFMRASIFRTSKKNFFTSKLLVGGLFTFLVMFLISFSGIFFAYLVPNFLLTYGAPMGYDVVGYTIADETWAYNLYFNYPVLHTFLISLWRGIVAILFYLFGVTVVFLSNNKFLVAIIPFVYYQLENFFWQIFQVHTMRTSYSIGLESSGMMTGMFGFAIGGPVLLAIILLIVYLIFIRNKTFELMK